MSLWTEEIQSKTEEWTTQRANYILTWHFMTAIIWHMESSLANTTIYVLLYSFCFFLFWIWWQSSSEYIRPGGLYLEGWFIGGFFYVTILGGLHLEGRIDGGVCFWNFAVVMEDFKQSKFNGWPNVKSLARFMKSTLSWVKSGKRKAIG